MSGPEPARRPGEPPAEAPYPSPDRWAGRAFAALGHRNYRLFFAGQGFSLVGSWARSAAQQWLVYDLTRSERWLALVAAGSILPAAVFAVPAGYVADRVDKRRFLLALQVVEMALAATLATLVLSGRVTAPSILAIATALGVAVAFETPCRQAFVVDLVGRPGLRSAVALNSAMFNLALVLGPALGTAMTAALGIGSVFVFDAASFLAAVLAYASIRVPPRGASDPSERASPALTAGFRFVASDREVRRMMLLLAVSMVFGWSYSSLLAAFARDVLRVGQTEYGWFFAASGVGACAGAVWVAGRGGADARRTAGVALALFAASLLAVAFSRHVGLAAAARALGGLSMIVFFATANAAVQMRVPDAIRGRVMALWTLVFSAALPLGGLVLSEAARATSVPTAFGGGASVVLAAALASLVFGRGQRSRETT